MSAPALSNTTAIAIAPPMLSAFAPTAGPMLLERHWRQCSRHIGAKSGSGNNDEHLTGLIQQHRRA